MFVFSGTSLTLFGTFATLSMTIPLVPPASGAAAVATDGNPLVILKNWTHPPGITDEQLFRTLRYSSSSFVVWLKTSVKGEQAVAFVARLRGPYVAGPAVIAVPENV